MFGKKKGDLEQSLRRDAEYSTLPANSKKEMNEMQVNYYRLKPVAWTNRLQAD